MVGCTEEWCGGLMFGMFRIGEFWQGILEDRMSGSWLKMRHDLADDPAVIRLATACQLEEDAVIGKLFRLWSWADRHTVDGAAEGVQLAWVDRLAGCQGFGAALVRVGWLVESDAGLSFPRFDRHCSDTAKSRALTKTRVERHRNAPSVTRALPEKRREEVPPPPREASRWEELRAAWNAGSGRPWTPPEPPNGAADRLAEPGWLDQAVEAIGRLPACRYFTTPVTLVQFCGAGFVARVLGGQYDTPKAPKGGTSPDGRRTADEAAQAWDRRVADPERHKRLQEFRAAKAARKEAARLAATLKIAEDT